MELGHVFSTPNVESDVLVSVSRPLPHMPKIETLDIKMPSQSGLVDLNEGAYLKTLEPNYSRVKPVVEVVVSSYQNTAKNTARSAFESGFLLE